MTWFTVSIVSTIQLVETKSQNYFPVFEDFYLFEAANQEELDRKISSVRSIIDQAGECTLEGFPARQISLGVRKIRSIFRNPPNGHMDDFPPADGTELSHSYYIASSLEDAKKVARGERVVIEYVDDCE